MMKITEVARSFSKTFQEKDFEPFNVFASYKGEVQGTPEEIREFSEYLSKLAEEDVRRITDLWTNKREAKKRIAESKISPF